VSRGKIRKTGTLTKVLGKRTVEILTGERGGRALTMRQRRLGVAVVGGGSQGPSGRKGKERKAFTFAAVEAGPEGSGGSSSSRKIAIVDERGRKKGLRMFGGRAVMTLNTGGLWPLCEKRGGTRARLAARKLVVLRGKGTATCRPARGGVLGPPSSEDEAGGRACTPVPKKRAPRPQTESDVVLGKRPGGRMGGGRRFERNATDHRC